MELKRPFTRALSSSRPSVHTTIVRPLSMRTSGPNMGWKETRRRPIPAQPLHGWEKVPLEAAQFGHDGSRSEAARLLQDPLARAHGHGTTARSASASPSSMLSARGHGHTPEAGSKTRTACPWPARNPAIHLPIPPMPPMTRTLRRSPE